MRTPLNALTAARTILLLLVTWGCTQSSTEPTSDQNVILDFSGCSGDRVPLWVAVQDGPTGEWTRLLPVNDVYSFEFDFAVGGIASVSAVSGNMRTTVELRTVAEFAELSNRVCPIATKTVGGSVAGLGTGDVATIWVSGNAMTSLGANGIYSLPAIPDGPVDLFAARYNAGVGDAAHRLILRRDLNLTNGGSFVPLDFASAEAVEPARATLTVAGAGAAPIFASMAYVPRSATSCLWSSIPAASSPMQLLGVPAALQRPDGVHLLSVISSDANYSRASTEWFHTLQDRTVTMRDPVPAPTVTMVAGPYKRLRASVSLAAGDDLMGITYPSTSGGGPRGQILASAGYLAVVGAPPIFPDLSAITGWLNSWMPEAASSGIWSLFVSDFSGVCEDGSRTRRISFIGNY